MNLSILPTLNATLNATAAVLLTGGYLCIKRSRRTAHGVVMTAAFIVSSLFLVSYLYYHAHHGVTRFTGVGWSRPVYFALLLSHTLLAMAAAPLALFTLGRATRRQFIQHKKIARWTWPVWLYVSVTGFLVYWWLYHVVPGS